MFLNSINTLPTLLLLPGLDGSGDLFEPLLQQLAKNINVKVTPIPNMLVVDHVAIAEQILAQLSEQHYVIFAESFSGRTAYELCRLAPERMSYVIFSASFIERPSRLLMFSSWLPLSFFVKRKSICKLIAKFLMGDKASPRLKDKFFTSLNKVSIIVLRNRLIIIKKLKQPKVKVDIPCFVINAKNDVFVNRQGQQSVANAFTHHAQHWIDSGHFVAQTHPKFCAKVIKTVFDGFESRNILPEKIHVDQRIFDSVY